MERLVSKARCGFSLVELLAVVLILALLALVAIPIYISTRKNSARRACENNVAAIAAAESAYALRHGAYTTTLSDLLNSPEGFAETPVCPDDSASSYELEADTTGALTIKCTNPEHGSVFRTLAPPSPDPGN